jgi:uncharacterized repeat protein (TIGR01451 family)
MMNREPDFESSADMRLLELQRASLGLPPPERSAAWESRYAIDAFPGIEVDIAVPQTKGALLAVTLTATPPSGVIPGTVLTYALSLVNDGVRSAPDVTVSAPLPGGAAYRLGSLHVDGRPADDDAADLLFGAGLRIGTIEAHSRATILWKVGVRMGSRPLLVIPAVRARETTVVGGSPLLVERKGSLTAFASELAIADRALFEPKPLIPVEIPADELPIYELDAEEEIVYEAADAALSSIAERPAQPRSEPPVPEPEPEPIPAPQAAAVREAVIFYGGLDRATLAFFERVFNGSRDPTILQHCIFASALACTVDADGNDALDLKKHLAAQSQILHRVTLHEKLGKREPIGQYAGTLTAALDAIVPAPLRTSPRSNGERLAFVNELHEPALVVLRKIAEERERWDFVKARQLTLALQAQRVVLDDDSRAAAIDNALRSYAQHSMTVLQKLFVRLRIDKTTGVLFQSDAALDSAARNLLATCAAALPN